MMLTGQETAMPPRIRRPKPVYRQIAEHEKKKIIKGAYRFDEPWLSIPRLAEKWGVARQTAHEAMKVLQVEGFLYSEAGRGTWPTLPEELMPPHDNYDDDEELDRGR